MLLARAKRRGHRGTVPEAARGLLCERLPHDRAERAGDSRREIRRSLLKVAQSELDR